MSARRKWVRSEGTGGSACMGASNVSDSIVTYQSAGHRAVPAVRSTVLNSIRPLPLSIHVYKHRFSSYSSPTVFCPACSNPLRVNWPLSWPNHIQPSHTMPFMPSVLLLPVALQSLTFLPVFATIRLGEGSATCHSTQRTSIVLPKTFVQRGCLLVKIYSLP
jgi:hypothetical protein